MSRSLAPEVDATSRRDRCPGSVGERALLGEQRRCGRRGQRSRHPLGVHAAAGRAARWSATRRPRCGGRASAGSPTRRARRRPARSSTLGRGEVQGGGRARGAASAARRTSTDSTGLRLCGIVDDPPRPPPRARRARAISGRRQGQRRRSRSARTRRCSATSASPTRVSGARRGVPRRRGAQAERGATALDQLERARPGVGSRRAGELGGAGQGAGGAAELHRQPASAGQVVGGVEHAGQPGRGLEPERDRDGVLGQGAARPSACARWRAGELGERRRPARAARRGARSTASRRHSIRAVSSTSWLVSPRCSQRRPPRCVARAAPAAARRAGSTGLPPASAPRRRGRRPSPATSAGEVARRRRRRDARGDQRVEPGLLDARPSPRSSGGVGEQVAGPVVAGPEAGRSSRVSARG